MSAENRTEKPSKPLFISFDTFAEGTGKTDIRVLPLMAKGQG